MRFIELHDHYGEPIAVEPGMITMVQAAEQDKHPTRRAVLHLRNNQMRAIRESYAEVMALIAGTATAEQATAERADLDERLAVLEMAQGNLLADYRELAERLAGIEQREVSLLTHWGPLLREANRRLGHHDEMGRQYRKRLAALEERQSDIMESLHLQRQRIAVLEDSIGGVSKRQGETYSDMCGLAERIKQVEQEIIKIHQGFAREAIRQNQEWRPAEGEAPDDETDEHVADFAREAEREQRIRYGD